MGGAHLQWAFMHNSYKSISIFAGNRIINSGKTKEGRYYPSGRETIKTFSPHHSDQTSSKRSSVLGFHGALYSICHTRTQCCGWFFPDLKLLLDNKLTEARKYTCLCSLYDYSNVSHTKSSSRTLSLPHLVSISCYFFLDDGGGIQYLCF